MLKKLMNIPDPERRVPLVFKVFMNAITFNTEEDSRSLTSKLSTFKIILFKGRHQQSSQPVMRSILKFGNFQKSASRYFWLLNLCFFNKILVEELNCLSKLWKITFESRIENRTLKTFFGLLNVLHWNGREWSWVECKVISDPKAFELSNQWLV